jgi:hypothetical protein
MSLKKLETSEKKEAKQKLEMLIAKNESLEGRAAQIE